MRTRFLLAAFLALFAVPAPAAMTIVQHHGAIHGNTGVTTDGSVTLGSAPTAGNDLIALIGANIAKSSITINTTYWTEFDDVESPDNGTTVVMTALCHVVQGGDAAALPKFWTAGATYWSDQVWEVSGVTGSCATDLLTSIPLWNTTSNVALPQFPIFAGGMALSGTASYNGSSNPSINGSWTLDDTHNNNANFGSAAGAHRVIANGDTIDGTWTQGTSAPYGGIFVLLTSQQPLGGVYPRHVYRQSASTGAPGSITVPWVPVQGSLLLAYLDWADGLHTNPTISGSWTDFKDATITTKSVLGLYRYVQGGDTAALPTVASAGSAPFAITFIELAGGSGTFATDHVSDKAGAQATGATLTTTADTTTAVNQFALLAYGNYNATVLSSTTGFTGYLNDDVQSVNFGSWFDAFKFFPNSGSSVQGVTTPGLTTGAQSYVQSIFNQGTSSARATSAGFFHAFP